MEKITALGVIKGAGERREGEGRRKEGGREGREGEEGNTHQAYPS